MEVCLFLQQTSSAFFLNPQGKVIIPHLFCQMFDVMLFSFSLCIPIMRIAKTFTYGVNYEAELLESMLKSDVIVRIMLLGDVNSYLFIFLIITRCASIRLGANMPARVERVVRRSIEIQLVGEPTGQLYEVILFFGIIDILQDYDISKKLEHAFKSMHHDPTSISAVDPRQYSKRFRDFLFRVFTEDT